MKNKVYIRLVITYLVVFLFPLFVNIFMLEDIRKSTQDNICKSVRMNLNHAKKTMENNLWEINKIVVNLSSSSNINYIATQMDEEDKKVEISRLLMAQDYMSAMRIQSFVEEYYLFFRESDLIISPNQIYLESESCKYFFQYGDMDWAEWETLMSESYSNHLFPEALSMQNKKKQKMLLYVQSLVTESGTKGNFIFPIKSKTIEELLVDSYIGNGGAAYLTDAEGKILLSVSSGQEEFKAVPKEFLESKDDILEMKLNGKNIVAIKSSHSGDGLVFTAVLPKEYITAQINQAQKNTLRIMAAALIAGLGCISILSWYRGRSINKILHMLFNIGTDENVIFKGDEMEYISNSLKQLLISSADMKENIQKQEPITRGLLIERLLRGGAGSEINKSLEDYGIYLNKKRLLVIAFLLDGNAAEMVLERASEITIYKQVLQTSLKAVLSGNQYLCDTDINAGAIVCAMEETVEGMGEEIFAKIEKLPEVFQEEYGIHLKLAVSHICKDLTQINKAYDQIYEILQYGSTSDKNVFFYEDYCKNREYYYYPMPLEDRLVNAVKMGNSESTHTQLTEIYQINVMESNISPSMMHFLVNDLQCTVFKIMQGLPAEIQIEEEIYRQLKELNLETEILLRFHRINNIYKYICEKVQEENSENCNLQKEKLEEYIQKNYSDSSLSLTKIAEDFDYASTYFSKLFKELFQENFAAYLEKIRIEKVCELLKNKNAETLEAISQKTGYNSVYVMRTAFKRTKGVTPNEYRKLK